MNRHTLRRITQAGFLLLILLAPVFDILRYDAATRELIVLGKEWSLGLGEGFIADQSLHGSSTVAIRIVLKALLPWVILLSIFPLAGVLFGRFFCGWLCPEGFLFEIVDSLSLKLMGRRSLWGRKASDPDRLCTTCPTGGGGI